MLATTNGTWHSGLLAYRNWLKTWYRPVAPRNAPFREVFNFRTGYLFHDSPGLNSGIVDATRGKWTLREPLDHDLRGFGGIDFLRLFDWARTPESQIAKKSGSDWMIADDKGRLVDVWGGGSFTMCQHVPGWQDYLAATCGRVARETGAAGLYLDQFGFLSQYRCSNASHGKLHAPAAHMLGGEYATLRKVREAVGGRAILYTEEIPTDVMTQFTDGGYTAAVKNSLKKGIACPIHLTRFALPDFKTIELLSEQGLQDGNLPGARAAFFNGEGLYLSGNASTVSGDALALIRKTHALLREHADAFTSLDPMPLIPTLSESVCANRFPAGRKVVWTFFNAGTKPFEAAVLRIPHPVGARYRDAWNGIGLKPTIMEDGSAELHLKIGVGDVGCVVQTR